MSYQMFEQQRNEWAEDSLDINATIVYEYVDEGLLSGVWREYDSISHIGFGAPYQWLQLQELSKVGLTIKWKRQLLDPKTYGVTLEWLVAEGIAGKRLHPRYVLCPNTETTITDPHEVVTFDALSLQKHNGLLMKLDPDDYRTGKLFNLLSHSNKI
jgi:hypothetical protein